jgi:hypothetical protein
MKNVYRLLLLLCSLLIFQNLAQAQTGTVRGFVYEENSGEPVIFTNAYLEGTDKGGATDINGFFNISQITPGDYTLIVTYLGYDTLRQTVSVKGNRIEQVKLFMKKGSVQMQAVEISAERQDRLTNVTMSVTKATAKDIKQIPTIGGVADLAQYMQILPGVIFTGDQGGQLFIRGGSPVQNLVLLDGMVIYNPFHSIGLFSVFDTEMIRSADIYTAGFGANYGGRVSSVMDVTTRDGNKRRTSGKVGFSTFQANVLLEGPLVRQTNEGKGSISYILSAKHSYLDESSKLLYSWIDERGLPFSFTDLYGKISLNAESGSKVNIFGFNFRDEARFQQLSTLNWNAYGAGSNFVLTLPGSPILVTGRLSGTSYEVELNEERDIVALPGGEPDVDAGVLLQPRRSQIGNFNFGLDFKVFNGDDEFSYGLEITSFSTDFTYFSPVGQRLEQKGSNSEFGLYGAYKIKRDRLILDIGLRIQNYSSIKVIRPEPRLGAKFIVNENFRIKAAAGRYSQNLIAANSDRDVVNLFAGFLIAPTRIPGSITTENGDVRDINNSLQKANHFLAGFEYDLGARFSANVEGYIKDFRQISEINRNRIYSPTNPPTGADPITFNEFTVETGLARGLDFTFKYEAPKYYIWAVYSLAKVDRWDGVRTYSPIFDRRHNTNLVVAYRCGKNNVWEFNGRWAYGSGFPFTQNQGFFLTESFGGGLNTDVTQTNSENVEIQYAGLNQGRLPDYHRLDITVKRTFEFGPNTSLEVIAGVTNVYDRDNIFYIDRLTGAREDQLPVLPSAGLIFSF